MNNYIADPLYSNYRITPAECASIVEKTKELTPQAAQLHGGGVKSSYRRATLYPVAPGSWSWLDDRLYEETDLANELFDFDISKGIREIQIVRYATGDHYKWHIDLGKDQTSTRKLAITIQLTPASEYKGGQLELAHRPKIPQDVGSVIIFPSYMMHRVTPVTEGVRWSLVAWVHGKPFR